MQSAELMDFLEKLASLIADTFGPKCEVAISRVDPPDSKVLAIFNSHVTGRSVGDPLGPEALERVQNSADSYYINYKGFKNGNAVKSSTISFTDGDQTLAFCINYDCADLENVSQFLGSFLTMQVDGGVTGGTHVPVIDDAIREGIALVGKPVRLMNKRDRLQVISHLEQRGIMKMQKSVQTVAQYLGISRYTVYNYLNELNAGKPDENIEP